MWLPGSMLKLVEAEKKNDRVRNAMPHPIPHESNLNHMNGPDTRLCHQHMLFIIIHTILTSSVRKWLRIFKERYHHTILTRNILECYISFISRLPLVDLWVSMFWWVDMQQHMRRHASLWSSKPPLWHRQVEQVYISRRHNYCVCMQGLSFCTYMISKVPCCAFSGAQDKWDSYTITIEKSEVSGEDAPWIYLTRSNLKWPTIGTIYLNRPDMGKPY